MLIFSDLGIQIHMSQSSTANLHSSQLLKRKVLPALIAVVIGHMGVLWAVSQLKTADLKPVDKKPISVKLLKIQEEAPPPPPPPPPIQEKVKPEPKPEPIKPPPVIKPKVIAQKPQEKVDKAIHQEDPLKKQRELEDKRLRDQQIKDQQIRDKQLRDQQMRDQAERDRLKREQDDKARQQREQDEKARQQREQDERNRQNQNQSRSVGKGDISWRFKPKIDPAALSKYLAKGQVVSVELHFYANADGSVKNVKMVKGSGDAGLDAYILGQARKAQFSPYKDNGVKVPFDVGQDYTLKGQ